MYPIHPKLTMDIARSTEIGRRKQEWPDDPNGAPVRTSPMPPDPLFMIFHGIWKASAAQLNRFFSRSLETAETGADNTVRALPASAQSQSGDCAEAA